MSWIHELAPMVPTPATLVKDLSGCWHSYRMARLPPTIRIGFCFLRAVQRTAYWAGWVAGAKEHRTWTPS